MACLGSRKCINCKTFFKPDPRAKGNQEYCSKPACRKESKRVSQHKWLNKSENKNHFCGPENVLRVQEWRARNPGYWKREKSDKSISADSSLPLQETIVVQVSEKQKESTLDDFVHKVALQETLSFQHSVLIGLIAHLTGSTLQDDISNTYQTLRQLGEDFLNSPKTLKGEHNAIPSFTQSPEVAPDST